MRQSVEFLVFDARSKEYDRTLTNGLTNEVQVSRPWRSGSLVFFAARLIGQLVVDIRTICKSEDKGGNGCTQEVSHHVNPDVLGCGQLHDRNGNGDGWIESAP